MLFLASVFLSKVVFIIAQSEFKRFFILPSFRVLGYSSRITGIKNELECCSECDKNATCEAVNFHEGNDVCELIKPGITLMSPVASTGWMFYYTDSKYLHHLFNAVTSQTSTRPDGGAVLAIDGDKNHDHFHGSCSHSDKILNPWWMVDLSVNFLIESVIMWNRLDCCYFRLRSLTITVSGTPYGVDDPDNVCATYPGPPDSRYDNPVVVNCTRAMLGRYVKIAKQMPFDEVLSLCEVEFV